MSVSRGPPPPSFGVYAKPCEASTGAGRYLGTHEALYVRQVAIKGVRMQRTAMHRKKEDACTTAQPANFIGLR